MVHLILHVNTLYYTSDKKYTIRFRDLIEVECGARVVLNDTVR